MATFSLHLADGTQVGETVEAVLPLTEPLKFGPLPTACRRATIKIAGVNGDYLGEYRSGPLVEGDTVHLEPRQGDPGGSIWTDMLSGL